MCTRNSRIPKIGGIPSKDLSRYFPGVHLDLFKFLFRAAPTIQLTRIPIISKPLNIPIEPEPEEPDLKLEKASPEKSHSPCTAIAPQPQPTQPPPPSSNILIEEIDLKEIDLKPEPTLNLNQEQNEPENHEKVSQDSIGISKILDLITDPSYPIQDVTQKPYPKVKPKSLPCPHCYKRLSSRDAITLHVRHTHKLPVSKTHPHSCDECPRRFLSFSAVQFHKLEHKYAPHFLKDFYEGRCSICNMQSFKPHSKYRDTAKLQILRYHILNHEGLMKHCKCSICGMHLRMYRLKDHEALHAKNIKIEPRNSLPRTGHGCPICGKLFKFKVNLDLHYKSRHGPIKCNFIYCKRTFPNEAARDKHAIIHDFRTTHLCPECGKTFSREAYLTRHLNVTHGKADEKFKCTYEGCGKSFADKQYFKKHVLIHMPKDQRPKYMCETCGAIFTSKNNLKLHCKAKHLQKYACPWPDCGHLNQTKSLLERHLKSHKKQQELQAKIKN